MSKRKLWSLLSVLAVALVLVFVIRAINPAQASYSLPDPCQAQVRTSAAVNVSTATTTQIVAAGASGTGIYVCGQFLNVSTTSATLKWEYGTQVSTPCDTGTTAITGVIATPSSTPTTPWVNIFTTNLQFSVPSGNQLCLVTTGTTPGVQGFITYVQG